MQMEYDQKGARDDQGGITFSTSPSLYRSTYTCAVTRDKIRLDAPTDRTKLGAEPIQTAFSVNKKPEASFPTITTNLSLLTKHTRTRKCGIAQPTNWGLATVADGRYDAFFHPKKKNQIKN